MTAIPLESASFSAGDVIYFDTSALLPLTIKLGASESQPLLLEEEERVHKLDTFVERAKRANAKLISTILAVEEIAALVRNRLRRKGATTHQCADWSEWKRSDLATAQREDEKYCTEMLTVMERAAQACANANLTLEMPIVQATQSVEVAKLLRKAHRGLLRLNHSLDPMDALHIAFGQQLGASHFVSFDKAWQSVTISSTPSASTATVSVYF